MLIVKITTAVSVVLILQTSVAMALSLGMYKSCLYECLHCVNTWGKELFNGELCAENCAVSGGSSIDTTCTTFFTRASRRVSGARQYLHSEDPTGRSGRNRLSGRYSNRYFANRSYKPRKYVSGTSYSSVRSVLSSDCQRLCRTCESRFNADMDVHSCMYTCVSTRRKVIAC